jgi:hypothetical protein
MPLVEVDRREDVVAAIVQEAAPAPPPAPGWTPLLSLGLGVAVIGMVVGTVREIARKE